ncbi:lipoprotein [soil metagenome]
MTAFGAIACATHTAPPAAAPITSQQPSGDANTVGDIPDNQAFVAYTPADGSFTVTVPEGWARTDIAGGAAFGDKLNSITVTSQPALTAPTVDSVNAKELPGIAAKATNFRRGDVVMVTRKAGRAVLATYGADSPPSPVTGKVIPQSVERYEFFRPGEQVTITLSGPTAADNVDPWRVVTDSFAWKP